MNEKDFLGELIKSTVLHTRNIRLQSNIKMHFNLAPI
jgi:hypothetical protein